MDFASSNLFQLWPGDLLTGKNSGWFLLSADTTGTVYGTGYLAAVGKGSRGVLGLGVSTGDIIFTQHGTTAFSAGLASASTVDQSSTVGSTGWNAAYNVTLTAITGL